MPKVLPRLCTTVTGDKNGKLRQCASSYLLQVRGSLSPQHRRLAEKKMPGAA
jgi:hypothetical protein